MSNNNYFQTPMNTSYGEITHANHNNTLNPLAHYCNCGGSVNTVTSNAGLFQVRCTNCPSFGVAHKIKEVAVFNWNECKLSQFPARLTVLPFRLTYNAKYNPQALLDDAKKALKHSNDTMNPILISALKYAVKWAVWFTSNNKFLSTGAMEDEMNSFNANFITLTESKLSVLQLQYLAVFKKTHKGLREILIYRNFLKLHCKGVLEQVTKEITYPNRLIKAA